MAFVDGYLNLLTAISGETVTEATSPRAAISFSVPRDGLSFSSNAWSFGFGVPGPYLGRGVWDAPTGGNLLLILPFSSPRPQPAGGSADLVGAGSGAIRLLFASIESYPDGAAFSGAFAAGVIGSTFDELDIINRHYVATGTANPVVQANTSPMTAGVALTINRGVLQATSTVPA